MMNLVASTKTSSKLQDRRSAIGHLTARASVYIAFALLLLIAEIVSPVFLSGGNISNMLEQVAPLGIVVIGQTLVIIVRGLDLSVGSVMATAAVAATAFGGQQRDVLPIIGVSLLIGLATGLANGLLITKRSVPPFLATLAMWIVLEGCRYAYNGGAPSGNVPPFFRVIGSGNYHGVPYNILIMAAIAAAAVVVLHLSAFGRRVFLVGGNPVMARLVGINVDRVVIVCYLLSGVLAATAGLVLSGFVGLVDNFVGRGFELDSIVAAVLGGVALSGGRGAITGALVGAAILVVINNAVLLFGLPIQVQLIVKGIVIVIAAALNARIGFGARNP
jgi:ribose/xylose/arabinose/galactoside ABC-type transport system permease subunit